MKKLLVIGVGMGLAVFGGLLWRRSFSGTPLLAEAVPKAPTAPAEHSLDSTFFVTTGAVGAGGEEPLPARTQGHVWRIFFTGGDYARRGQVLVKLDNHTFVTAPHAGFLGSVQVVVGQRIGRATPVTTLSRRSYLVVPVRLPGAWQQRIRPGDSARVWAGAPPVRMATGLVGPIDSTGADGATVEIRLTSRAPFRIGESARVRLHQNPLPVTAR